MGDQLGVTTESIENEMTDLEKLKTLLDSFGVGYSELTEGESRFVTCIEGSPKVGGYNQFYTTFAFRSDGSFNSMGCWE